MGCVSRALLLWRIWEVAAWKMSAAPRRRALLRTNLKGEHLGLLWTVVAAHTKEALLQDCCIDGEAVHAQFSECLQIHIRPTNHTLLEAQSPVVRVASNTRAVEPQAVATVGGKERIGQLRVQHAVD